MVDEILIGLGASIAVFLLLGRRMKNSDMATRKRIQMREVVDRILFTENLFLKALEVMNNPELYSGKLQVYKGE